MVVLGASGLGLHAMAIAKARGAGVIAIDRFESPTYRQAWIRQQGINGDLSVMCRCSNEPKRSR
jgi:D-arabinose 1-dehydrogenase-like Zn-dependent alcohol dehydrogenase